MATEPNNTQAPAIAAPVKAKSKPAAKSPKLIAADIPAAEWEALAKLTGSDIATQGKAVRATAAFCQTHSALSARDMAAYMSAHYTSGALSHTTIAQHKRLDLTLSGAVDAAMLSDELYGMARSILGAVRYGWERWETALKWESVTSSTHTGERSALAVRLITETYTAAQSEQAQQAAELERKAASEAAKLAREAKAAEAAEERAEELRAATAELTAELETLRGSLILPGEPGSWESLTALLSAFLPYAADMPRHTGAALAALMASAGSRGETGAKSGNAPARKTQSKPAALAAA